MRIGPAQLPDHKELLGILANEEARAVPPEKESAHYGNFSTVVALLQAYGLPTAFFENAIQFSDLEDQSSYLQVSTMFADLVDAIVREHGPDKRPLLDALYDYLSEEDPAESADIIFVFGSKETFRTERAVALYKQGLAPYLVISGRGPFYEDRASSEADRLGQFALESGVPSGALILEREAISVPDNVKRSLNLLEREAIPHANIILANSPFAQRRGWAHFNKFSKPGTKLIRQNAKTGERFQKDRWFADMEAAKIVTKEFFGLRISELINTS